MNSSLGIHNYFRHKSYHAGYADELLHIGFERVMLWWGDYEDGEFSKYTAVEEALKAGLVVENFHAPYKMANILWEGFSHDDNIAYSTYKQCIADAGRFNVPYIVIHPTRSHITPDNVSDVALYRIRSLLDYAQKKNVILAFENLMDLRFLDFIFQNIQHPNLGFCYDSGHAFCFNREIDLINKYSHLIVTTHLHDNYGINDSHRIVGDGLIDWNTIMTSLYRNSYKGNINLECSMKTYSEVMSDIDFLSESYLKAKSILFQYKS